MKGPVEPQEEVQQRHPADAVSDPRRVASSSTAGRPGSGRPKPDEAVPAGAGPRQTGPGGAQPARPRSGPLAPGGRDSRRPGSGRSGSGQPGSAGSVSGLSGPARSGPEQSGSGQPGSAGSVSGQSGPGQSRPGRSAADEAEPAKGRPRIDPRFAERWVRVRREQGRRRLHVLIGAVAVVAVISLTVGLLHSPLFNVRHIRITAPPSLPRAELLGIAGLSHPEPLIDIDTRRVAARIDAVPTLGAARVSRHWPRSLTISVAVRTPVAAVARAVPTPALPSSPAVSQPGWVTVDATGRVLAQVQAAPALPVLQGTGEVPPPGGWLTGSAGPRAGLPAGVGSAPLANLNAASNSASVPSGAAAALAIAAALPPALRARVISVTVVPSNQLRMAVLAPAGGSAAISVNLGDGSQLAAKLTALATLLAQGNLAGVVQIDLTVPDRPATLTARQTAGTVSTHAGG